MLFALSFGIKIYTDDAIALVGKTVGDQCESKQLQKKKKANLTKNVLYE